MKKLIIAFLIIVASVFVYQLLFPKVIKIENIPEQTPEVIPQVIPQDYKG